MCDRQKREGDGKLSGDDLKCAQFFSDDVLLDRAARNQMGCHFIPGFIILGLNPGDAIFWKKYYFSFPITFTISILLRSCQQNERENRQNERDESIGIPSKIPGKHKHKIMSSCATVCYAVLLAI